MSEAMPCAPQKSSISCVSAMPPISEPAKLRRFQMTLKVDTGSGFSGAPTCTSVPSRLTQAEIGVDVVLGGDRVEPSRRQKSSLVISQGAAGGREGHRGKLGVRGRVMNERDIDKVRVRSLAETA